MVGVRGTLESGAPRRRIIADDILTPEGLS
jgi:hypothetical protein